MNKPKFKAGEKVTHFGDERIIQSMYGRLDCAGEHFIATPSYVYLVYSRNKLFPGEYVHEFDLEKINEDES